MGLPFQETSDGQYQIDLKKAHLYPCHAPDAEASGLLRLSPVMAAVTCFNRKPTHACPAKSVCLVKLISDLRVFPLNTEPNCLENVHMLRENALEKHSHRNLIKWFLHFAYALIYLFSVHSADTGTPDICHFRISAKTYSSDRSFSIEISMRFPSSSTTDCSICGKAVPSSFFTAFLSDSRFRCA